MRYIGAFAAVVLAVFHANGTDAAANDTRSLAERILHALPYIPGPDGLNIAYVEFLNIEGARSLSPSTPFGQSSALAERARRHSTTHDETEAQHGLFRLNRYATSPAVASIQTPLETHLGISWLNTSFIVSARPSPDATITVIGLTNAASGASLVAKTLIDRKFNVTTINGQTTYSLGGEQVDLLSGALSTKTDPFGLMGGRSPQRIAIVGDKIIGTSSTEVLKKALNALSEPFASLKGSPAFDLLGGAFMLEKEYGVLLQAYIRSVDGVADRFSVIVGDYQKGDKTYACKLQIVADQIEGKDVAAQTLSLPSNEGLAEQQPITVFNPATRSYLAGRCVNQPDEIMSAAGFSYIWDDLRNAVINEHKQR